MPSCPPLPRPASKIRPPAAQVFGTIKATLTEAQAIDLQSALATAVHEGHEVRAAAAAGRGGNAAAAAVELLRTLRAVALATCARPCPRAH